MSLSSKKPTISIPQFQKPSAPSFSAYGQTATSDGGTGYKLIEDPTQLADRQAAEQVRRDLINSLGLSGSGDDPFAKKYLDESLRIAQPTLENALIQRGLGGSSVYQGALTDLISKATSEAILNSQNQKLATLSGLQSSYIAPYEQLGQNLLQLAASTGLSEEQIAASLYGQTLPYTAQINYPKQSGLAGLISGGIQGAMSGSALGPLGMIAGGLAGGAVGNYSSAAPAYSMPYILSDFYKNNNSGLNLQSLLGLMGGGRAF